MKKYVGLISVVIILIITFWIVRSIPRSYTIEYDFKKYKINESYDKNKKVYTFKVNKDKIEFVYLYELKYSPKKKLVKNVNYKEKDGYKCISLTIDKAKDIYQCYKDGNYADPYVASLVNKKQYKKVSTYKKIDIYNKKYNYYIWNGYGITDIKSKTNYNFLKKESYDNLLSYKMNNFVIFADYDSSREFNKFYVFNENTKKVTSFEFENKISTNSYFMGSVDNFIYLFDKKNKVQYKINIEKQSVDIVSDNYGGIIYDKEWTNISYNKLVYNESLFNMDSLVSYKFSDNTLYYQYRNSPYKVQASNKEVDSIIHKDSDAVYYLSKSYLYRYSVEKGEELLINNFEWIFSSKNKIFIFD